MKKLSQSSNVDEKIFLFIGQNISEEKFAIRKKIVLEKNYFSEKVNHRVNECCQKNISSYSSIWKT